MTLPVKEPALIFAILAAVVLLVPMLSQRLRIPGIVGLIVAGVILGPETMGVLERGEIMENLGRAGLLYILFLAGLEIDISRFIKYRNHSLVFGSVSFTVPLVIGFFVSYYVVGLSIAPAILLASMFASHTLIAYPVASRLGITKNTAVTASIGGTIITDNGALLILAVIANSTQGELTMMFWGQLVVGLAFLLFVAFWILPRLTRWFFRTVPSEGGKDFLFVLMVFFTVAWLARVAGVEPIIGAFVAGLALNSLIPEQSPLMSRIRFVGSVLLIPIFLISVGMLVDVEAALTDTKSLKVVAAMSITVIAAKFAAAFIAGQLLKYTMLERMVMFGMTVNQAAATLAAVIVGFELELFSVSIVNGTVIMILVTCLVGPSVTEKYGRRLATADEQDTLRTTDAPQRILVPLANPASAEALMDLAVMIRQPRFKEPVYPLAVVTDDTDVEARVAQVEKVLAVAVIRGAAGDVPVTPMTRVDANAAEGIRRALVEQRITTVVIGWNGQVSFASRIFGSVLDQLTAGSRQLLIVAKPTHPMNTVRRLVLAVPRFARNEATFGDTVRTIKLLATQLSVPIKVVAPPAETKRLKSVIEEVKPEVEFEVENIAQISHLPRWIKEHGNMDDDLVVLLSARGHRLSWTPALDTLPRSLASQFPDLSFLVVFPAEPTDDAPLSNAVPGLPGVAENAFVNPARLMVQHPGGSVGEALAEMLAGAFADKADLAARIRETLETSAAEFPAELREGVVLLHCHQQGVEHPMLFVGTSPKGFTLPGDQPTANILFALVSPAGLPPARHLKHLSVIASSVRNDDTHKALLHAPDATAAYTLLSPLNE